MTRTRAVAPPAIPVERVLTALALAIALLLAACGPGKPATDATAGKDAKSITVVSANEVRDAVQAGRGRVTLVNFWATWCPPCVKELPHFAEVHGQYDRGALHFVSITADHKDTIDDAVTPFLKDRDIPFPILLMDAMPDEIEAVLAEPFPGNLPVTLLYGRDGTLAQRWDREVSLEELKDAIDALLS